MTHTGFKLDVHDLDWQPGNGTRYMLAVNDIGGRCVLSWIGQGSMLVDSGKLPHWRYVAEKMRCNEADALAVVKWLESLGWKF